MSRQRYEPVPQRDEIIILDSISSPSYNYNTALPTGTSTAAPSTTSSFAHSIPNSPPPSFHSSQSLHDHPGPPSSPGTPRPTPSRASLHTIGTGGGYAELWGVAPSTMGETTVGAGDALATIAFLKSRVEKLEESIGRLLLEKEDLEVGTKQPHEGHCCTTFSDLSPAMEREVVNNRTCCVAFRSATDAKRDRERALLLGVVSVALGLMVLMLLILMPKSR